MSRKGSWKGGGKGWHSDGDETTVVLTGVPKTLNAEILLALLDEEYLGCYDYFYLPMDMDKFENTGLAYINFRDHDKAVECQRHFAGYSAWPGGHFSERTCRAQWSSIQGYEANIQKQQKLNDWVNSNIPEDCKPMVFDEYGTRLPTMDIFPPWDSQVYHGWRSSETPGKAHVTGITASGDSSRDGSGDRYRPWKDEWMSRGSGNGGGYRSDEWRNSPWSSDWSGGSRKERWSDSWRKENYDNENYENYENYDRKWDRDKHGSQWERSVRWVGWNGHDEYDEWSNGHNGQHESQRQVVMEETSNENAAWPWHSGYANYAAAEGLRGLPGLAGLPARPAEDTETEEANMKPWSLQAVEGGYTVSKDTGDLNAKFSEVFQNDPDPKASSELPTSEADKFCEPEALASLVAVTRYACPCCNTCFAKWSACQNHIFSTPKCHKEVVNGPEADVTDLQARCKGKAEELPPELLNGPSGPNASDMDVTTRRFQ